MKTRTLFAVVTGVLALGAGVIGTLLGTTPARAGAAQNPDVTNPAIRKIIDSRLARLPAVDKSKASGVIGENNKGFLEIRGIDAVKDPKDRDAVQRLVDEENADRTTQFAEVAKAEKADASQIPKIQERYAQTFRDRAKAGEWIQLPDGVWKKK